MLESKRQNLLISLELLNQLNLLDNVILIGSWAEYIYTFIYSNHSTYELVTRDIDFIFKNTPSPAISRTVLNTWLEKGYFFEEDILIPITRLYKDADFQLEFLWNLVGKHKDYVHIPALGFNIPALRDLDFLIEHTFKFNYEKFTVSVPRVSAFVLHKILIHHKRTLAKRQKDARSILFLINIIQQNADEKNNFILIYGQLTSKQLKTFKSNLDTLNLIDFFDNFT